MPPRRCASSAERVRLQRALSRSRSSNGGTTRTSRGGRSVVSTRSDRGARRAGTPGSPESSGQYGVADRWSVDSEHRWWALERLPRTGSLRWGRERRSYQKSVSAAPQHLCPRPATRVGRPGKQHENFGSAKATALARCSRRREVRPLEVALNSGSVFSQPSKDSLSRASHWTRTARASGS